MNLRSFARVSVFPSPYFSACQPVALSSFPRMRRVRSGYFHRLGFALAAQAGAEACCACAAALFASMNPEVTPLVITVLSRALAASNASGDVVNNGHQVGHALNDVVGTALCQSRPRGGDALILLRGTECAQLLLR